MPTYYVTLNRPAIEAANEQEAAQKTMSEPLTAEDKFYVKENPPEGSMNFVAGAATVLGGAFPTPDNVFGGPDITPV